MKLRLLLSLLVLTLWACEDSREACLDFYAENYDVGAVSACDSCCRYPDISLSTNYLYDTLSFDLDAFYRLSSGDSIAVSDFELVLSAITFLSADSMYNIINRVSDQEQAPLDNYFLVNARTGSESNLGQSNFSTALNGISFALGVEKDSVDNYNSTFDIAPDSQLATVIDSSYNETNASYFMMQTAFLLNDSIPYVVEISDFRSGQLYPLDKFISPGTDWNVLLSLDMFILFDGIQAGMTQEDMEDVISDNLGDIMSVE